MDQKRSRYALPFLEVYSLRSKGLQSIVGLLGEHFRAQLRADWILMNRVIIHRTSNREQSTTE